MKKKILSILTALAMCLSLLPTAAFAEGHTCADGDDDHWCDECWEYMPERCSDADEDDYCDTCYTHLNCIDEDDDHLCDACGNTVSDCADEDHDHYCDLCGEAAWRTDPLDSGYYGCEAGCGALQVSVTGDYTELNYHGFVEGTLVDGTAEVSVEIPNYQTQAFEPVENGTVTVFWTDEEGSVFESFTVEDAELVDGKVTVSFTNLPIEILHRGHVVYKPADATYLPDNNGMVLEYQDNAYRLSVDSNVDCTINGVYEDDLYLFAGTEVSILVLSDAFGTLTWSYDDSDAEPEYTVMGSIVNFTMPEGDVSAVLEYNCVTCFDEDGDHWCDYCDTIISECADEDSDHYCDICWEYLPELCTDGEDEATHICDICWTHMPELCADEDDDHACDLCEGLIEGVCYDDDDHYCNNEACGNLLTSCEECDEDEDNICDLCGENIYPGAGDLNIEAVAGDGTITVTWDALEDAGTDKVASYIVSCCLEETFEPLQQAVYEPGSESYSHIFSDLENDVVYDVSVDAVYTQIEEGYEEPFSATAITTVTALPGAPTILSAVPGNGSVTLEWEAPENKGFPEIHTYLITAMWNGIGFGMEVEATGDTMSYTLEGVGNGNTYQIYVSAVNDIGQGAAATTDVEIPLIPYQLEIDGVMVTEENMNDVLGDGTVSLDPVTITLTLNNAHINVTDGNYGIRSKTHMRLKLIGENSISCSGVYGFHSTDDVTVIGDGSLDITANDVGIYIAGNYEVGGLYLKDDVTLNVTSGNVSSGNSYGVRVDDVLEVRDNAKLTATAGTAPERSCAIYAYDEFNVYDNAVVTATGADQSLDLNTDCDGIRTTHITINGGTVTATGGTAASTNGIFTQTFEMHGGTLTAVSGSTAGGTCFGPSAALQSTRSFNMTDGVIFATSGSAGNDTSCGVLVSSGELRMEGGSLYAQSGEANFSYGVKASQLALFSDGYIEAEGAEGVWCSNGINVEGSLIVDGGAILAKAANAETYSYGLQAFEMTISGGDVEASAGSAANSYGLWAFGNMDIRRNAIRLNPYGPGFIGTRVTASAENGYAVYSRTGVEIADTLTISAPEGASVAAFGKEEDFSRYYFVAAADGTAAQSVEIELLTYKVFIEGLDISYDMVVEVPAGWSVNEAYCEKYGVADFSEILPINKDGYTFRGWYTSNGDKFSFGDAITADTTIRAEWSSNSSGNRPSSRPSATDKTENSGKTFADVHDANHWAKDAIDFVIARGIFNGTSDTTFNPDGSMTRQAMWMILARMSGEKPANMDEAKAWAVKNGISDGSNPTAATSRQQFVTMLWRWAKAQGKDVSVGEDTNILSYEDAFGISEYAIPAFQWACGESVVGGYADGTLKPGATATRAHVAKMLMNFLKG